MNSITTTLEAIERNWGPEYRPGILVDHLDKVAAAGLAVRSGRLTDYVVAPGGRAIRVLCGALVEWVDEDGLRDGRCGQPVVPGGTGCAAHHLDQEADCPHGMAASLCAGPGHYPAER